MKQAEPKKIKFNTADYNLGALFSFFRIKPRLADPSFKPQSIHILATMEYFLNVLKIRYSSPLFCLRTANAIQVRTDILPLQKQFFSC